MDSLASSTHEVDAILSEVANVVSEREVKLRRLEEDLSLLEAREKEIQNRIDVLKQVPIEAATHFADLLTPSEARSARRDYLLFGTGVLVTTILAIAIQIALP